jgi:DNA replication protein DnaC
MSYCFLLWRVAAAIAFVGDNALDFDAGGHLDPGDYRYQGVSIVRASGLPVTAYSYAEWKRASVAPDYQIEVVGHYYSVPSQLIRGRPQLRGTTGLMVDRKTLSRNNKSLGNRLKFAGLQQAAVVEDVDLKAARQLDKPLFARLAVGDWIDGRQNWINIGEKGLGKSWLACAPGHKACRDDRAVLYQRVPRMFDALALAAAMAVTPGC